MIIAKIENGKETQYLELPCEQETLNAKFGVEMEKSKSASPEKASLKQAHIADSSRESAFDHQLHLRVLREPAVGR